MNSFREQGDTAAGRSPAGRRPWATPRVIVSLDAANAEAKGAIPTQETSGSAPNNANYSVS